MKAKYINNTECHWELKKGGIYEVHKIKKNIVLLEHFGNLYQVSRNDIEIIDRDGMNEDCELKFWEVHSLIRKGEVWTNDDIEIMFDEEGDIITKSYIGRGGNNSIVILDITKDFKLKKTQYGLMCALEALKNGKKIISAVSEAEYFIENGVGYHQYDNGVKLGVSIRLNELFGKWYINN